MSRSPSEFAKQEFIKSILDLKGRNVEYYLTDGSSVSGILNNFNPYTGEYFIIDKLDNIHIISHYNCLKIIIRI